MRWKVKLYSNDDLRQRFIDRTSEGEAIGLKFPGLELKRTRIRDIMSGVELIGKSLMQWFQEMEFVIMKGLKHVLLLTKR